MIDTFYLSDEELADITGYTRRHAEIMLGGIVETSAPPKVSEWKPNVAAIRRA